MLSVVSISQLHLKTGESRESEEENSSNCEESKARITGSLAEPEDECLYRDSLGVLSVASISQLYLKTKENTDHAGDVASNPPDIDMRKLESPNEQEAILFSDLEIANTHSMLKDNHTYIHKTMENHEGNSPKSEISKESKTENLEEPKEVIVYNLTELERAKTSIEENKTETDEKNDKIIHKLNINEADEKEPVVEQKPTKISGTLSGFEFLAALESDIQKRKAKSEFKPSEILFKNFPKQAEEASEETLEGETEEGETEDSEPLNKDEETEESTDESYTPQEQILPLPNKYKPSLKTLSENEEFLYRDSFGSLSVVSISKLHFKNGEKTDDARDVSSRPPYNEVDEMETEVELVPVADDEPQKNEEGQKENSSKSEEIKESSCSQDVEVEKMESEVKLGPISSNDSHNIEDNQEKNSSKSEEITTEVDPGPISCNEPLKTNESEEESLSLSEKESIKENLTKPTEGEENPTELESTKDSTEEQQSNENIPDLKINTKESVVPKKRSKLVAAVSGLEFLAALDADIQRKKVKKEFKPSEILLKNFLGEQLKQSEEKLEDKTEESEPLNKDEETEETEESDTPQEQIQPLPNKYKPSLKTLSENEEFLYRDSFGALSVFSISKLHIKKGEKTEYPRDVPSMRNLAKYNEAEEMESEVELASVCEESQKELESVESEVEQTPTKVSGAVSGLEPVNKSEELEETEKSEESKTASQKEVQPLPAGNKANLKTLNEQEQFLYKDSFGRLSVVNISKLQLTPNDPHKNKGNQEQNSSKSEKSEDPNSPTSEIDGIDPSTREPMMPRTERLIDPNKLLCLECVIERNTSDKSAVKTQPENLVMQNMETVGEPIAPRMVHIEHASDQPCAQCGTVVKVQSQAPLSTQKAAHLRLKNALFNLQSDPSKANAEECLAALVEDIEVRKMESEVKLSAISSSDLGTAKPYTIHKDKHTSAHKPDQQNLNEFSLHRIPLKNLKTLYSEYESQPSPETGAELLAELMAIIEKEKEIEKSKQSENLRVTPELQNPLNFQPECVVSKNICFECFTKSIRLELDSTLNSITTVNCTHAAKQSDKIVSVSFEIQSNAKAKPAKNNINDTPVIDLPLTEKNNDEMKNVNNQVAQLVCANHPSNVPRLTHQIGRVLFVYTKQQPKPNSHLGQVQQSSSSVFLYSSKPRVDVKLLQSQARKGRLAADELNVKATSNDKKLETNSKPTAVISPGNQIGAELRAHQAKLAGLNAGVDMRSANNNNIAALAERESVDCSLISETNLLALSGEVLYHKVEQLQLPSELFITTNLKVTDIQGAEASSSDTAV